MKFRSDALPYLDGKEFSNGLAFRVADPERQIALRTETLQGIVRDKKIIHVGFADHLPLIAQKLAENRWLHAQLCEAAARCAGVDTNSEAIALVEQAFGIGDLHNFDVDVDAPPASLTSESWDYLVAADVLEHVDNPVRFLALLAEKLPVKRVVITVPNAFSLENVRSIFRNEELINTDHRYWFTPYTLAKVGVRAGLEVEEFFLCQNGYAPSRLWDPILRRFPLLRETVVMVFDARRRG